MAELRRSNVDRRHPFRTFVFSTVNNSTVHPESRTVVKRHFDENNHIVFFTHGKSPKVQHIRHNSAVAALFYHGRKRLQIRVKGNAFIMDRDDDYYKKIKGNLNALKSRNDYLGSLQPGTVLDTNSVSEADDNTVHFEIIKIVTTKFDILQLNESEHERWLYLKEGSDWKSMPCKP